jgi:hypothetical protein
MNKKILLVSFLYFIIVQGVVASSNKFEGGFFGGTSFPLRFLILMPVTSLIFYLFNITSEGRPSLPSCLAGLVTNI